MPAMRRMILAVGLLLGACGGGEVATGEPDAGSPYRPRSQQKNEPCTASVDCVEPSICDLTDFSAFHDERRATHTCRERCVHTNSLRGCAVPACDVATPAGHKIAHQEIECGANTRAPFRIIIDPWCGTGVAYGYLYFIDPPQWGDYRPYSGPLADSSLCDVWNAAKFDSSKWPYTF
jgi:hypothetical protein